MIKLLASLLILFGGAASWARDAESFRVTVWDVTLSNLEVSKWAFRDYVENTPEKRELRACRTYVCV